MDTLQLVDPVTEAVRTVPMTPLTAIEGIVARARRAQPAWGRVPPAERARVLEQVSSRMDERREALARAITADIGRPVAKSRAEVGWAAERLRRFCRKAPGWLAPRETERGRIFYEPLGVAAVIAPWNYPLMESFRQIEPALLAGNAVVYKPSELAPGCGAEIARLFQDLDGFPGEAFQTVFGGEDHGRKLVEQDIRIVSLIGSTATGKDIMRACAGKLHRLVMGLGGLDAALVLKDADIAAAARAIVRVNCENSGQLCCAVKRVYVEKEALEAFEAAAVAECGRIRVGDPADDVDMGPLVSRSHLRRIEEFVKDAQDRGARVLIGGRRLERSGFFFPPTILAGVTETMRVMKEEPFGPLLPIVPVDSWEEGVRLGNDTPFGLMGSVWTKNLRLAGDIASRIEVGMVGVNVHAPVPLGAPWVGSKESGFGRFGAEDGLRGFAGEKYVFTADERRPGVRGWIRSWI